MDTDYLTRDAYRVLIGRANEVSDILPAEIGSAARAFADEDTYLRVAHQFVSYFAESPEDYIDKWDLHGQVDPKKLGEQFAELAREILLVIQTPIEHRGPVPDYGG